MLPPAPEIDIGVVQVSPVPPSVAQAPARQLVPAPHTRPHEPQFEGSVDVSTHVPPHRVAPSHVQAPPLQNCPAPHTTPQRPQFDGSVVTSRQTPPHIVATPLQPHTPPEQT